LDAALERKVIREADRIVTVSSYLKRVLEDRYGDRVRHKIDVITNGFDSKDLEGLPEISPHRKFTISYAGNFYGGKRDPTPFFQALRRLLDNGTVAAADLEVRLLGPEEPFARAVAEKWGLGGNVVFEGLLPYRDTLIQLRNSWALLLISLHGSYELSQKLFDYLACGRPIIAICPEDSEAASIIRAANAGYVIGNGDVSRLSDVISQLYRKWRAGVFQSYVDDELMRLFDRRSLTRRLANVMEEVVPG
jgi:glycosyltransferase involved in cell wall biosynthesis